jgi:hypothetical protein
MERMIEPLFHSSRTSLARIRESSLSNVEMSKCRCGREAKRASHRMKRDDEMSWWVVVQAVISQPDPSKSSKMIGFVKEGRMEKKRD